MSNIWQIHPFGERNTRTTAVFLIKYLKTLGFDVTNDLFAENAFYFRNALVRANYNNISKQIYETNKYLEMFLRNLLFKENNELLNRYLHVVYSEKPDIGGKKPDIGGKKPDIGGKKPYIELAKTSLTNKTKENIFRLYQTIQQNIFGRKDIIKILNLSPSRSSELIKQMLEYNLISPVSGFGKGRYKFNL